jgi:hypothetical protein
MSLNDWLKNGWLIKHPPRDLAELDDLLAVADRDLHDCKTRGLSDDWRFGIAYNAALQLARAALHWSGYEVLKGDSHHFRAIDSLRFTVNAQTTMIDQLQVFRKKRAAGVYEVAGMITKADADAMAKLAAELRAMVEGMANKR